MSSQKSPQNTMNLGEMSQNQLIAWIESIATDASFKSSAKRQVIDGIKKNEIVGQDFFEAEDRYDIQEMTGVNSLTAKQLFKKILEKKEESSKAAVTEEKQGGDNDVSFALAICTCMGKLVKIEGVSKSWTVAQVKAKYAEQYHYLNNISKNYIWKSPLEQFEFRHNGSIMKNNSKLDKYGIVNGNHLPLMMTQRMCGGGDWTIMYERCPVCLYKNMDNNNNLAKGYWHHPGGDKAEFKSSKPGASYAVEIHHTLNQVRCGSCKKECDGTSWMYKCPNHDYEKIPL